MSLPATDDFNRTDADPIGGNWTTSRWTNNIKIVSNKATPAVDGNAGAFWNADTFGDDQYSQFTTGGTVNGSRCWLPSVRIGNPSTSCACYYAGISASGNDGITLHEMSTDGSRSELAWGGLASFSLGKVIRCEVEGTTIRGYYDGSKLVETTDSTVTSGQAGIQLICSTSTGDDWEGGNLAAAGQPTIKRWGGVPGMSLNKGVW